jgi:hypothetical protein
MAEIIDRGDGIRIFNNSAIQASIDKALASVPKDKSGSVVAFIDESKTVQLAAAGKLGDNWSIVGQFKKPYHKPIEASAAVVFTWK